MEKLIKTWKGHDFERDAEWIGDGVKGSYDFKRFALQFRNAVKRSLPENWKLHECKPNWFTITGFVHNTVTDKWIYFSISDVRFWKDEWCDQILIRTANGPRDFKGGGNHYTSALDFKKNIEWLGKWTIV